MEYNLVLFGLKEATKIVASIAIRQTIYMIQNKDFPDLKLLTLIKRQSAETTSKFQRKPVYQ